MTKKDVGKLGALTWLTGKQRKEIKKILDQALVEAIETAKKAERSRCYRFAIFCRDQFKKRKDLPQDIVTATEVVAEGILSSGK